MFTSWHSLLKRAFGVRHSKFRLSSCIKHYRPTLENLEDRFLPSTFTVSTISDSGTGSLRDAISRVNMDTQQGTDVINFNINSAVKTITLDSALPTITHPVVIDATTQP